MADKDYAKNRINELENEEGQNAPTNPVSTSKEIRLKISELRQARAIIFDSAKNKARAISNFAKNVAIKELKLKNGLIKEWEGIEVGKVTASSARKIAEGMCWFELNDKEEGEALYKAHLTNIEAIKAELNGLQSINKHLD
jgi:hypothetical protein